MSLRPAFPRRPADLGPRAILLLFVLLFAIVAIPVITHPVPPLSDYANHLARMHVIGQGGRDPDLARFYSVEWAIIPNLMMDLVVPVIDRFTSVYAAGEIYTLGCFALITFGTLALNRALFGLWSATPLLAFPLLYNGIFLIGVMNYIFGIGLALLALAAWVSLRGRPLRYAVSVAFVVALFFCHLVALGVYGIGLLAFEIGRIWEHRGEPLRPRLLSFCAAGLPFLAAAPLLAMSPTLGLSGENFWAPQGKVAGVEFIINVYYDVVAFGLTGAVAIAGVWALRHGLMRTAPLLIPLLIVGALVYLAMPRTAFATYMADQRIPTALAFMVLASVRVDLRSRLVRRAFAVLLVLLLCIRVAEVQMMWDRLTTWTDGFRASVAKISRGSRVLVAYADPRGGGAPMDLGLVHAACLAMIEKGALVTTAFTVPGKQILRANLPYRDFVDTEDGFPPTLEQLQVSADSPTPDGPRYWDLWPKHFDYVYVLYTEPGDLNPDPERLDLVAAGARFQLYKVKPEAH
ncbi:MAG: hypothetical protein H2042_09830 [Rhizobiales bacterium]|nr:hypothetical protein [Hyphomicrobiales bacterium]